MNDQIKIMWAYEQFNGPVNGIILCKGKKCWFQRSRPTEECDENIYELYELESEIIDKLEDDHNLYCKTMGISVLYDDYMNYQKINVVDNSNNRNFHGNMMDVKFYSFNCDTKNLAEKMVCKIRESDITNLNIPHEIKIMIE